MKRQQQTHRTTLRLLLWFVAFLLERQSVVAFLPLSLPRKHSLPLLQESYQNAIKQNGSNHHYGASRGKHKALATMAESAESWNQPLMLSMMAGLSTCIGAAVVFCLSPQKKTGNSELNSEASTLVTGTQMAFSLSLAGSVMVTVSFVSILPESFHDEMQTAGSSYQMIPIQSALFLSRCTSFGVGCLLYVLLSKCAFPEPDAILEEEATTLLGQGNKEDEEQSVAMGLPVLRSRTSGGSDDNSASQNLIQRQSSSRVAHEEISVPASLSDDSENDKKPSSYSAQVDWNRLVDCSTGHDLESSSARRAWRVTMLLFISLAVHNFPEGLAVAASTMHSMQLGLTTTVAIALHNIPEGIAIAIPCLSARPDSPWLAFWLASVSGLAEPLGALVALFVLNKTAQNVPNDPSILSMNNVLAFVAGIMSTVAFVELFPEAMRHSKENRLPLILGLVVGAAVMIGSDVYLEG